MRTPRLLWISLLFVAGSLAWAGDLQLASTRTDKGVCLIDPPQHARPRAAAPHGEGGQLVLLPADDTPVLVRVLRLAPLPHLAPVPRAGCVGVGTWVANEMLSRDSRAAAGREGTLSLSKGWVVIAWIQSSGSKSR